MASVSPCDEDLVRRLPLPLAQLYRRAHNARAPLERHQAAFYLWEAAVKLLGATAIVAYADLGAPDPDCAERLKNLARPALGHWWEFIRVLVPVLAKAGDARCRELNDLLLGRARTDLPAEADVWQERRGPSVNSERFVRKEVLARLPSPLAPGGRGAGGEGALVWAIDEADRLFPYPFGSQVFGLFRSWHNARVLDPESSWSRLTLAIAYATEAHLFITDMNQSPFNIGTLLSLEDFSRDQVAELNGQYGGPLRGEAEVEAFHGLVGGHPYLTNRGLYHMVHRSLSLAAFQAQADRDDGIFGDHLRRILVVLARDPALADVVRGVLNGKPCPTPESFYRLRSAGLLAGDSARDVRPRCRLYALYLGRHLM